MLGLLVWLQRIISDRNQAFQAFNLVPIRVAIELFLGQSELLVCGGIEVR